MIRWFVNLKVSRKIMAIVVLLSIALVGVGYSGIRGMNEMNRVVEQLSRQTDLVILTASIRANIFRERIILMGLASGRITDVTGAVWELRELQTELRNDVKAVDIIQEDASEQIRVAWSEVETNLETYMSGLEQFMSSDLQTQNLEQLSGYIYGAGTTHHDEVMSRAADFFNLNEQLSTERQKDASAMFMSNTREEIIVVFVVCIVAIGFGLLVSRVIATPLLQLQTVAERVAKGDLTCQIITASKDEVGSVSEAFGEMIMTLRDLIGNIAEVVDQANETSQQLAAAATQNGASIQEIAASSEQLAAAVEQVTSDTQSIADFSRDVTAQALSGGKDVEQVNIQMKDIEGMVADFTRVAKAVGQESGEIEKIVGMIAGIADQTNLLALNAAIEAARAGEHGRGFAVVADEVRKLAEQSANATSEIGGLIKNMTSEADRAIASAERGSDEVTSGLNLIYETGDIFAKIISAIEALDSQVQDINAAVQQIGAGGQQIASSTQQQSAQTQQIASMAESLSELGERLAHTVNRFSV